MTKQEVLDELTKLYNLCYDSSINSNPSYDSSTNDDGWMAMARIISTAEDVAIREIRLEKEDDGHTNIRS